MKVLLLLVALWSALAPSDSREVAGALAVRLREAYVDPRVGDTMAGELERRAAVGEFDRLTGDALAVALNAVMRGVTPDPHLGIRHAPEPAGDPAPAASTPATLERMRRMAAAQNFGFEKVERLAGNVGFLELNGFVSPDLGSETAVAAMAFLANADAIVIDLRYNSGGVPGIGMLLSSYFFDRPRFLHSMEWREPAGTRVEQFWTLPFVPGRRLTSQPLFILTSRRTISAAESFAYSLQAAGRATIVGEVTAGGGHAGREVRIGKDFVAFMPTGRAVNPVTKTNWEGTGVQPDVPAEEKSALAKAHQLALETLRDAAVEPMTKAKYESALEELRSQK